MTTPERVSLSLGYQNVYGTARSVFHANDDPPQLGHIWPVSLGELIAARRRRPSVLHEVRVYRGVPDPERQPKLFTVNERQAIAWSGDQRVQIFRRSLRYNRDWPASPPQEKGIDVALAVDLVRIAAQAAYDVAVVFSRDTDLMPALEAVREMRATTGAHIEVATWDGAGRLRFPNTNLPWCHILTADDYHAVHDTTDYLRRSPKRVGPLR